MESYFDKQVKYLYNKAEEVINTYAMLKANHKGENFEIDIPQDFKDEFFIIIIRHVPIPLIPYLN